MALTHICPCLPQDIQIDALLIRACEPVAQAHCHVSVYMQTYREASENKLQKSQSVTQSWCVVEKKKATRRGIYNEARGPEEKV